MIGPIEAELTTKAVAQISRAAAAAVAALALAAPWWKQTRQTCLRTHRGSFGQNWCTATSRVRLGMTMGFQWLRRGLLDGVRWPSHC